MKRTKAMFHKVFLAFLFILCSSAILSRATPTEERERSRVILFKGGVSTVPFEDNNGTVYERKVNSFRVPSLVDVDGVMVAIADARYDKSNDNSFIETVVKYSVDNGETWETQIAVKNSRASNASRVMDPTVIVKGNKIYVLLGRFHNSTTYWNKHPDGKDWEPVLSIGEVNKTNTTNGKVNATITWTDPVSLKSVFPDKIAGWPSKAFLGGVGVATATTKGALVFPVQAMNMIGKVTATIMYSIDDGKTWKFAKGITALGCTESSILEWEGKLIMNSRVDYSPRKVFESTDMGATWTEAVGTLSQVWGNSPTRQGPGSQSAFIPVTIEGKRVMLFTHPLNFKGMWNRDRLHLWVTDNNRIFNVSTISVGDVNAAYSSLLYKDDRLFCLHETNINETYSLVFVELKEELELIKSVVRTWINQDKNFSDICTPADSKEHSRGSKCSLPFPTAGLVGFLSNEGDGEQWKDAYRCVNASTKNAEKVPNGLRFKGVGAGARWPVSGQGQNHRYHFANHMFTLVATVQIVELPTVGNSAPLLGVSLDGAGVKKVLGLSFSKDRKWNPIYGKREAAPTGSWKLNETYQVALTLHRGVGSIYVDGEPLRGSGKSLLYDIWPPSVSHFYIGGYGGSEQKTNGDVTVTNVLLYNRQLSQSEIRTLFLAKDQIGKDVTLEYDYGSSESSSADGREGADGLQSASSEFSAGSSGSLYASSESSAGSSVTPSVSSEFSAGSSGSPSASSQSSAGSSGALYASSESSAGSSGALYASSESSAGSSVTPSVSSEYSAGSSGALYASSESSSGSSGSLSASSEYSAGSSGSPSASSQSSAGSSGALYASSESSSGSSGALYASSESSAGSSVTPSVSSESSSGSSGSLSASSEYSAGSSGSPSVSSESSAGSSGALYASSDSSAGSSGSLSVSSESSAGSSGAPSVSSDSSAGSSGALYASSDSSAGSSGALYASSESSAGSSGSPSASSQSSAGSSGALYASSESSAGSSGSLSASSEYSAGSSGALYASSESSAGSSGA